ncbi:uncharacterized protein ARMOST_15748 [Armillaria ostoyae]|uniref:Uncharacterized protein n=1 Tax=Armillaria ostoyae TaxID=47428 RepID=A0A284RUD1_ARMOS|nr:uncharacterized protein ARMOST_15748 [Armillaria ostoyae]
MENSQIIPMVLCAKQTKLAVVASQVCRRKPKSLQFLFDGRGPEFILSWSSSWIIALWTAWAACLNPPLHRDRFL